MARRQSIGSTLTTCNNTQSVVLYNNKSAKEWLKGKVHSIRGDGSVALETNSFSTFLGGRQRFHTKQIRQHLKSNQINGKG